jgi:hypothetical protein
VTKGDMEKCTRDRSSLADLHPMRWVASRRWFLGIALHGDHGCVGSPSSLLILTKRANAADEWAWSPLVVSGVPHDPDDEWVKILRTPRMIPVMGLKWPSPHSALISPVV